MKNFRRILIFLVFSFVSIAASASSIDFSGYASIRAGIPVGDVYDDKGDGSITDAEKILSMYDGDKALDFKRESVLALQARKQINRKFDATLLLQARGINSFSVEARWAFIGYQATDNLKIIVGRFALPVFRYSDRKEIGFANDYTRLPRSIYSEVNYQISEGTRVTYSNDIGDLEYVLEGSYSNWDGEVSLQGTLYDSKINNTKQLSLEIGQDWWSVFGNAVHTKFTSNINPVIEQSLAGLGFSGSTNQERFFYNDDDAYYASAGFSIDYSNILIDGEYVQIHVSDSLLKDSQQSVFRVGYRAGKFTPSFVYERSARKQGYASAAGFTGANEAIIKGVTDAFNDSAEYTALSLHLRYDIASATALKASFTNYNQKISNGDSNLVTLGIDVIF